MNWVFLRGLSREAGHWGTFPNIFKKKIPKSKIHFLDLPGFGTEFQGRSPVQVSKIVEDIRKRWVALKESEGPGEWSLLAISLGGMVGAQWVAKNPDDFKFFCIINSSAGNLSSTWRRLKPLRIPDLNKIRKMPLGANRELAVLKMTTRILKNPEKIAEEWGVISNLRPPRSRNVIAQLLAAMSFRAPRELKAQTLVVSSLKDDFTDSSCSDELAKYWAAKQVVHPEAGHDLPLDDPEWLATKIKEFVRS